MRPALSPNEMPRRGRAAGNFPSGTCHDTNLIYARVDHPDPDGALPMMSPLTLGWDALHPVVRLSPSQLPDLARFSLVASSSTTFSSPMANCSALMPRFPWCEEYLRLPTPFNHYIDPKPSSQHQTQPADVSRERAKCGFVAPAVAVITWP